MWGDKNFILFTVVADRDLPLYEFTFILLLVGGFFNGTLYKAFLVDILPRDIVLFEQVGHVLHHALRAAHKESGCAGPPIRNSLKKLLQHFRVQQTGISLPVHGRGIENMDYMEPAFIVFFPAVEFTLENHTIDVTVAVDQRYDALRFA